MTAACVNSRFGSGENTDPTENSHGLSFQVASTAPNSMVFLDSSSLTEILVVRL